MSEWRNVRIKDIGNVVSGGTPKTKIDEYWNGDIAWITPKDLSNYNRKYISKGERSISDLGLNSSSTNLVPAGTILMTSRAPIGYLAIAQNEVTTNQGFKNLICNPEHVYNQFMYYYFKVNIEYIKLFASGATFPEISATKFKNIKIPIPSLETQNKIADFLSIYDELIENNNRRIEVLEQTAEEIYKEWFVRMRFPEYENTKFDKGIPEGWQLKKVDDIISFDIGGGWGKYSPEDDFTEEAFVIRGTDIPEMKYGEINYELLRYHKDSHLRNRRLKSSDIIFEASGGSKDQRLGRTYYITDETLAMYDEDVICASFCKLIRIDDKYLSWYFSNYLNYAYKTEALSIFEVQSTGISNFGFTKFKKHHQVLLPPKDLMKLFFDLTYNMYIENQRLGRKNQNLKKQRDLLLPRLMNGTIKVK